jgi:20S proteasome alpha/beta subunit
LEFKTFQSTGLCKCFVSSTNIFSRTYIKLKKVNFKCFQVYSVPIGGALVRQAASIGGSGSTYLYGFMDANYREGMNKEECVELVKQCVTLAINRDGSSGGCCRIAVVTRDGIERRLFHNDRLPYFGELSKMPSLKA